MAHIHRYIPTPCAQTCLLIYTHNAYCNIHKREKNKNVKPATWDLVPSLHTSALDGTRRRDTGKWEDRKKTGPERGQGFSQKRQRDRAEAVLLASPPAPAGLRATSLSRTLPTLLRVFCPAAPSVTSPHPSPPGTSRLTYKSTPPLSSGPTSQGQENCRTGPRRPRF